MSSSLLTKLQDCSKLINKPLLTGIIKDLSLVQEQKETIEDIENPILSLNSQINLILNNLKQGQIQFFTRTYPNYQIIKDIGSGLNLKREGFNSILDLAIKGDIQELVVTNKSSICISGFELYESIINKYSNGKIVVLNQKQTSNSKLKVEKKDKTK
jgi:hypothetical protein